MAKTAGNVLIRRQVEGNETCCERSFLLEGALYLQLQAGIERWESYVSRCEKKSLEALVPEELEKHLILNSNRLRTFEDARLEIVTHVGAKFGLRIRDSKPSATQYLEDNGIPWMLML